MKSLSANMIVNIIISSEHITDQSTARHYSSDISYILYLLNTLYGMNNLYLQWFPTSLMNNYRHVCLVTHVQWSPCKALIWKILCCDLHTAGPWNVVCGRLHCEVDVWCVHLEVLLEMLNIHFLIHFLFHGVVVVFFGQIHLSLARVIIIDLLKTVFTVLGHSFGRPGCPQSQLSNTHTTHSRISPVI